MFPSIPRPQIAIQLSLPLTYHLLLKVACQIPIFNHEPDHTMNLQLLGTFCGSYTIMLHELPNGQFFNANSFSLAYYMV